MKAVLVKKEKTKAKPRTSELHKEMRSKESLREYLKREATLLELRMG